MTLEDYIKSDEYKEEVAVVQLINPGTGRRIKLVGMVHIGSKEYYKNVKRESEDSDIILYERITPSTTAGALRDRLIFTNGIRLSEFYREAAARITDFHYRRLTGVMEALIKEDGSKIRMLNGYRDRLVEELGMVFQGDVIDYEHLPSNWHHADMTHDELKRNLPIFSSTNFYFGLLRLGSELLLRFPNIMDLFLARIVEEGIITGVASPSLKQQINRQREGKVYEKIDALENQKGINQVAVVYGVDHLSYLEAELTKRGYVRQNITYLEAVRKQPKDWERMDKK